MKRYKFTIQEIHMRTVLVTAPDDATAEEVENFVLMGGCEPLAETEGFKAESDETEYCELVDDSTECTECA